MRYLLMCLLSIFILASCNTIKNSPQTEKKEQIENTGNNDQTEQNNKAEQEKQPEHKNPIDKNDISDLAIGKFTDYNLQKITAKLFDKSPENLTFGDISQITGVDVYFYAERISNTNQYKKVCSVTVKKQGFDEVFDRYYSVPAQEREGLKSPEDYYYSENIEEFNGYTDLAYFYNLKELSLTSEYAFMDFDPIKFIPNLAHLESLSVYNYHVPSLDGLANYKNLEELSIGLDIRSLDEDLKVQYIQDLTPLSSLKKLKTVSLSGNRVSDLSPLTKLENLSTLTIFRGALNDISPVAQMKNLESITLMYNAVSDVSPLVKLNNLKYINLDYNLISDITPFKDLDPNVVEYVSLDMNGISAEGTLPLKHLGESRVNFGFDPYWDEGYYE